jgi:hypothetical protein
VIIKKIHLGLDKKKIKKIGKIRTQDKIIDKIEIKAIKKITKQLWSRLPVKQ